MDKNKIAELAQNGIDLIDGKDKDVKCAGCRNCDESFCPLLALFEKIQKEAKEDG